MEFFEVVKTRRSVRAYNSNHPNENVIEKVLEVVRLAPSGSNRQPWRFIKVTDAKKRKELVKACGGQDFIWQAPIIIVACGYDIKYNRGGYMESMSFLVDVSIAFTHLILAARAEGLGTCWIGAFKNDKVKEILDIPDEWQVVALTPIGYPSGNAFVETTSRKTMNEILSEEKF